MSTTPNDIDKLIETCKTPFELKLEEFYNVQRKPKDFCLEHNKNIKGEEITLNKHGVGFFSVKKQNEIVLKTFDYNEASVFYANCF